jgi:hypothetical protein
VAIATATLAIWPGRPLQTFGGLWGLSICLMTVYWSGADDSMVEGFWFTLYVGTFVGTVTFGVWVACGLIVWSLQRFISSSRTSSTRGSASTGLDPKQ